MENKLSDWKTAQSSFSEKGDLMNIFFKLRYGAIQKNKLRVLLYLDENILIILTSPISLVMLQRIQGELHSFILRLFPVSRGNQACTRVYTWHIHIICTSLDPFLTQNILIIYSFISYNFINTGEIDVSDQSWFLGLK